MICRCFAAGAVATAIRERDPDEASEPEWNRIVITHSRVCVSHASHIAEIRPDRLLTRQLGRRLIPYS